MTETPQSFTWEDVQDAIRRDREENEAKHSAEMDVLRSQVTGALAAATVPEHSAGPGTEVRSTWSLAEQTAAREAASAAVK